MTQPRRTVPGQTYLITRRCSERRLFLKPIKEINEIVRYGLGLSLERFAGIKLHGYVFMGNHMHLVLTDEDGVLSDFMAYLCAHIARAANRLWDRGERFWGGGSFHSCELVDHKTIVAKLLYVILNPVKAGLVCEASEWPGAISLPDQIGTCQRVQRPTSAYYAGRKCSPERPPSVKLELSPPKGSEGGAAIFAAALTLSVTQGEEKIQAEFEGEGRSFLGASAILAQKHTTAIGSSRPTYQRADPVACGTDSARRQEALEEIYAFREAYRQARAQWLEGVEDVVFPLGTNGLRRRFGVAVVEEDAPPG